MAAARRRGGRVVLVCPAAARRRVLEARHRLQEGQLHVTYGAILLLGDADLGDAGRLARARASIGLSQEAFGDVSGRAYVSQLERGERHATLPKIDDLASVLGMHPASLVVLANLPQRFTSETVDTLVSTPREELLGLLWPN